MARHHDNCRVRYLTSTLIKIYENSCLQLILKIPGKDKFCPCQVSFVLVEGIILDLALIGSFTFPATQRRSEPPPMGEYC
jgi:hypothetical protein